MCPQRINLNNFFNVKFTFSLCIAHRLYSDGIYYYADYVYKGHYALLFCLGTWLKDEHELVVAL